MWVLLALITVPLQGAAATWHELIEMAWQRSPEAQSLVAQAPVLQARRIDAERWLPAAPALSVSHRSDQWYANEGVREWEAELEAPLWRNGQRQSQQQAVAAEDSLLAAQSELSLLTLAGELREQVWALAESEAQRSASRARLDTAEALARDVERRVAAGELAQADALLVRSETLAARNALEEADLLWQEARQKLLLLAGQEQLPSPLVETPHELTDIEAALGQHPRFKVAQRSQGVAQAEVNVARQTQAPVSASLLWAQNRDALDESDRQSVGVKITVPLGADARQRSAVAAAEAGRVGADAQRAKIRRDIEQEIKLAQWALQSTRRQYQQAEQQYVAAQQSLALSRRAFDAGELDLVSLLRVQQTTQDALLQRELKRMASERAVAKWNQALGVLP